MSFIQQSSIALHQFQMGAQRIKPALHRLGGQIPVRGNFSGQLREILLPQSCQQLRRQLSLQQSAVQGVFRLGSRKRTSRSSSLSHQSQMAI